MPGDLHCHIAPQGLKRHRMTAGQPCAGRVTEIVILHLDGAAELFSGIYCCLGVYYYQELCLTQFLRPQQPLRIYCVFVTKDW